MDFMARRSFSTSMPIRISTAESQRCAAIARYVNVSTRDQRRRAMCFKYRSTIQIAMGMPMAVHASPASKFTLIDLASIRRPVTRQIAAMRAQATTSSRALGLLRNTLRIACLVLGGTLVALVASGI